MATKTKIYAPKGFKIRSVTVLSGIPVGKTTFKVYLGKARLKIPFPKKIIKNGTGYKLFGGGSDSKGEYLIYFKK